MAFALPDSVSFAKEPSLFSSSTFLGGSEKLKKLVEPVEVAGGGAAEVLLIGLDRLLTAEPKRKGWAVEKEAFMGANGLVVVEVVVVVWVEVTDEAKELGADENDGNDDAVVDVAEFDNAAGC